MRQTTSKLIFRVVIDLVISGQPVNGHKDTINPKHRIIVYFSSVVVQVQLLWGPPSPVSPIWSPLRLSDDVPERKGCLIRR